MNKFLLLLVFTAIQTFGFSQESYNANQVIVMMNGTQDLEEITNKFNDLHRDVVLKVERTLSQRANVFLMNFDSNTATVKQIITLLKDDERFALVQPNHNNIKQRSTIPNDLDYPAQWSVGNTATARIFAPEAWDISTDGVTNTGDTIVMAVVDGGVDINHIDLDLYKNKHEIPNNGIDDDNNGYVDDYDGWSAYTHSGIIGSDPHGTHIAGTIGAKTNNSEGVAGLVWGGKILPINASSSQESVVIEGYGYALELRSTYNETNGDSGAFVVATNSSFGVDYANPANYPIWCAFYDSLGAAGVLNMGATSNSGIDIDVTGDVPTTCPSNYMVAVSNINQNGSVLGGYGATEIDLAAPGTDILSTTPGHNYGYKTGTSMATPHVVGVVGAMYSAMCGFDLNNALKNPDSLALWVRDVLLESVDSVANLNGKNNTSGRLNMFTALKGVETVNVAVTHTVGPASDPVATDGTLNAIATGGTQAYTYLWNTGATTASLTQVAQGSYSVTVTEKYGCTQTETFDVWTLGLNELQNGNGFIISPNPTEGSFSVLLQNDLLEPAIIQIYDGVGRLVFQEQFGLNTSKLEINPNLNSGLYFVRLNDQTPQVLMVK
jgi:hypothetical protein